MGDRAVFSVDELYAFDVLAMDGDDCFEHHAVVREMEMASSMMDWLNSSGLRPPS
jgi:hypothetical protein